MSALQREQIVDNYVTSLTADITAAATTIPVSSTANLPTNEDFRIYVEGEIMRVTGFTTGQLTVVRGVENTTAAVHASGTSVLGCFTSEGLTQYLKDRVPMYGDWDGVGHLKDSADAAMDLSDFTWLNQGTSTATEMPNGEIKLTSPTHASSGPILRGLVMTAPATPYTLTARFCWSAWGGLVASNQLPMTQLCFRESATSKISSISMQNDCKIAVLRYDDVTTYNSSPYTLVKWVMNPFRFFFQIEDDGTNIYYRLSNTGRTWSTIYSTLRGTFFTVGPNQVGWLLNARFNTPPNNTTYSTRLQHWSFA